MILDVGCGGSPKGDVNLDQFYDDSPHTTKKIEPKQTLHFIIADAHRIPVRDKAFSYAIMDLIVAVSSIILMPHANWRSGYKNVKRVHLTFIHVDNLIKPKNQRPTSGKVRLDSILTKTRVRLILEFF